MENVRIGIIGIGNMGSSHVKWIMAGEIEHLVLTAVADIREERRAWVRETYPDVAVFDDAEALMTSGLVDAVLIATPHYLHPPLAIAALNHGLHVMSEKPAGVYTKAVREENELARKSDKTFAIMFNQRTHCMYRKVKEIIASGELGALRRVNWLITDWFRTQYYYDSGSWRATWDGEGGGVLLNQCPHNLDLLQWMVGMPVRVRAFTHNGKWHNIEVEDDVTAYMEFENGATGVFITSTGDMPGDNRLEIVMEGILKGLGKKNFSTLNSLAEYIIRIACVVIFVKLYGTYLYYLIDETFGFAGVCIVPFEIHYYKIHRNIL